MAGLSQDASTKWINGFLVIVAIMIGYIIHSFVLQLGDWFDLEAKIPSFLWVSQGFALACGALAFLLATKHEKSRTFLDDVYSELVRVIWPDKDSVMRLSFGIMVGVGICSMFLVLVDLIIQKILGFLY